MTTKEKKSIEKFVDTLNVEEKYLLSEYLNIRIYGSLSEKFDEILKKSHETKKTNS